MLLRYNYRNNISHSDKVTNRFNPLTGLYDLIDTFFTNDLRNTSVMHNPDASLLHSKGRFRGSLGMGVQWLMQGNEGLQTSNLHQRYRNSFPLSAAAGSAARPARSVCITMAAASNLLLSNCGQFPDNSNPLYVQLGNPNLKPSLVTVRILLCGKPPVRPIGTQGTGLSAITNQIMNETWFDSVGRQVSRPLNVSGNHSLNGNITHTREPEKKDWSLRANVSLAVNYGRNQVL